MNILKKIFRSTSSRGSVPVTNPQECTASADIKNDYTEKSPNYMSASSSPDRIDQRGFPPREGLSGSLIVQNEYRPESNTSSENLRRLRRPYKSESNLIAEDIGSQVDKNIDRPPKQFPSCSNLLETVTLIGHRTTSRSSLAAQQWEAEDDTNYIRKLQDLLRNKELENKQLREENRQLKKERDQINIHKVEHVRRFFEVSTAATDQTREMKEWFAKIESSLTDMRSQIVNSVSALKKQFDNVNNLSTHEPEETADEIQKLCNLLYNLVGGKWREFATALNIPYPVIARIQKEHSGRVELGAVFFKIIREWKIRVGVSVSGLLKACVAIGIDPLNDRPMPEIHKQALQHKAERLREDLIVPIFCSNLRDNDVLSASEVQYIMSTTVHNEQINRLLDVAPFAGANGFSLFINGLKKTGHGFLAKELLDEEKLLEVNRTQRYNIRDPYDRPPSRQLSIGGSISEDSRYQRDPFHRPDSRQLSIADSLSGDNIYQRDPFDRPVSRQLSIVDSLSGDNRYKRDSFDRPASRQLSIADSLSGDNRYYSQNSLAELFCMT